MHAPAVVILVVLTTWCDDVAVLQEEGVQPEVEKEEGEITEEERQTKEDEKKQAEAERQARRRMLGNIQFIGHLFKNGLLTERIIHSCIVQLLKEEEDPRPDDVECLCKLLTTCGKQVCGVGMPFTLFA